jgi:hypothetical protein
MTTSTADVRPQIFDKELVRGFSAENEQEWAVACDADVQRGWAFPVQSVGHPERRVGAHVAAILRNIPPDDALRSSLRFVALVHDSMKWAVQPRLAWSIDNDHAVLARRVAERHTSDRRLLLTIELHDEAYWIFKTNPTESAALDALLVRLPDPELYLRFVELDATTEGKDASFLLWLRNELGVRGLLPPGRPETPDSGRTGLTTFLIEWVTEPDHQERFAAELDAALTGAPGAEEWHAEVLRSSDGARVVLFGRAAMPTDVALLRGRPFAQRLVDQVDQTGARLLEARALQPVEPTSPSTRVDAGDGRPLAVARGAVTEGRARQAA